MELTGWIVILAVTLMAIALFCARSPASWSREHRVRRLAGTRFLVQAACALWAALLLLVRSLLGFKGLLGVRPGPRRRSRASRFCSLAAAIGRFAAASCSNLGGSLLPTDYRALLPGTALAVCATASSSRSAPASPLRSLCGS